MGKVGAIVLSRLDSTRLRGKALKTIRGKPLVQYVIERAGRIRGVDEVVLATSDRAVDDPLADFGREHGFAVFRGSSDDVAGRILSCARQFGFSTFVRVCGDSPLYDYEVASRGLETFGSGKYDIVTNRFPRSFPVGNSLEIVSTEVFAKGYDRMSLPDHFEHVTLYFYQHSKDYRIYNLDSGRSENAQLSLAVDTPDDLERFDWMLGVMGPGYLEWTGNRVIDLYHEFMKGKKPSQD